MSLIEWTRLEGGQVEAVAMLVNREHPNSVRITPSRAGTAAVDILDRNAGPGGSDVVYQVKRYTEKLTKSRKDKVEDSLVGRGVGRGRPGR